MVCRPVSSVTLVCSMLRHGVSACIQCDSQMFHAPSRCVYCLQCDTHMFHAPSRCVRLPVASNPLHRARHPVLKRLLQTQFSPKFGPSSGTNERLHSPRYFSSDLCIERYLGCAACGLLHHGAFPDILALAIACLLDWH